MKYLITLVAFVALALPAPAQFNGGDSDTVGSLPRLSFDWGGGTQGLDLARLRFAESMRNGDDRGEALARFRFEAMVITGQHPPAPQTYHDWQRARIVMLGGFGLCNRPAWPSCATDIPTPCKGPTEWNYCDRMAKCKQHFDDMTWPGMSDEAWSFQATNLLNCLRDNIAQFEQEAKACACQGSRITEVPLPFGGFPL